MKAHLPEQPLDDVAAALVRQACAANAPLPPALADELQTDATLRAEFEASRALADQLRSALAPEPLDDALHRRIVARVRQQSATYTHPLRRFNLGVAAAAAAALVAILNPWYTAHQTASSADTLTLTSNEAAAIVAAMQETSWVTSVSYRVDQVEARLKSLTEQSALPWGEGDDWDVPRSDAGTSGRLPGDESQVVATAVTQPRVGTNLG